MPTLYAMYLQATRKQSSGKMRRRQWIMLPPLTEHVLSELSGSKPAADERFLKFYREQSSPENRVKWRWEHVGHEIAEVTFPSEIRRLLEQNRNYGVTEQWQVSPVITAQITARELATLFETPQTPYVMLRRFDKVAKAKHNLAI